MTHLASSPVNNSLHLGVADMTHLANPPVNNSLHLGVADMTHLTISPVNNSLHLFRLRFHTFFLLNFSCFSLYILNIYAGFDFLSENFFINQYFFLPLFFILCLAIFLFPQAWQKRCINFDTPLFCLTISKQERLIFPAWWHSARRLRQIGS